MTVPTFTIIRQTCQQIVERCNALGYKGKRRDTYAIEQIVGACFMAKAHADYVGESFAAELADQINRVAYIISIRGFSEVKLIAERQDSEVK